MEYSEIEGEQKGSKVLVTEDQHLYKYAKPNTPYLICHLGAVKTQDSRQFPTGQGGMPHSTIEFDIFPYIPGKDNKYICSDIV